MGAFCTNCGTPLPEGAGFCPKCGTKVEVLHCPSCGKELDFGVDFCIYCGQRLKEGAPAAEPEQEASAPATESLTQPEPPTEEKEIDPPKAEAPADLEPSEEAPSNPEGPQEFTWSQVKPQGRVGSAVTTVRVWLEQEMLHIQEEFSDTITTHKNTLPEKAIPLSEIKSVYTQKKGPSVSVILLFLCVALVLYGGVSGTFDLGITALCLLGLVVMFALRYRRQMKRYQLVIVRRDGKKIVLKGNGDSLPAMDEAAQAILTRAGIDPSMARSAGKRAGHKPLWIILGVVIVLILGVLLVPELYLKQSFPASVIQNQNVKGYVGTGISGDLNYQFVTEVTGGKLVKNTSMPQYEDGLFTYYFVDCVYDVTITADDGESVSGQVTVDCSFSVEPFGNMPENILLNSFTYSDVLETFISEKSSTQPDKNTQPTDSTLPDDLPLEFFLASGAGNWTTIITLNGDGTFEGAYSDMDMGEEPTYYQSVFSGAFDGIKRINDYTYTMTLNELNLEKTPGEEWYDEIVGHMVATEPVGLRLGETYLLYTSEAPLDALPQNLFLWEDSMEAYVLCIKGEENGFVSEKLNLYLCDETGSLTAEEKTQLRKYNYAQRDQARSVTAVVICDNVDDSVEIDSLIGSWRDHLGLWEEDAIIFIEEDSGEYHFHWGASFPNPDKAWEILQQGVEESDTWGEAIMYYIEKIQ